MVPGAWNHGSWFMERLAETTANRNVLGWNLKGSGSGLEQFRNWTLILRKCEGWDVLSQFDSEGGGGQRGLSSVIEGQTFLQISIRSEHSSIEKISISGGVGGRFAASSSSQTPAASSLPLIRCVRKSILSAPRAGMTRR